VNIVARTQNPLSSQDVYFYDVVINVNITLGGLG